MQARSLMTADPVCASVSDHLATAALKMWQHDCGIIPVVDDERVEGVITDRDIAMALAMKGAAATSVRVGEVISGEVFSCQADDDVAAALDAMNRHQVRRLVVLDGERLAGVLSLNDIVLEAGARKGPEGKPTHAQVLSTLRAICVHRDIPVAV